MSSSKGQKNPRKSTGDEKWDAKDVIQAVLIADSFNYRFLPISLEQPRALLPLVNTPLIDYTLEFLVKNGVEEIFVYCKAHADMIRQHIDKSHYSKSTCPASIRVLSSDRPISVGDVLRDIYSRSLIQSDFVLVSGDVISNMDLRSVIQKHKERRRADKMTIMSVIYKQASPGHRTRSSEDDILVVVDADTSRLIHYEKVMKKRHMNVPLGVLKTASRQVVDLCYDLMDCHVSVCSPQVPAIFSDNFDYETRDHFVRGILVNEEVLGNNIYVNIIVEEYAARVSNLHTYDAISKDVINRWVYPLVPDQPISNSPRHSYSRHNVYLGSSVVLGRDCKLTEDVVIGQSTSVGGDTRISKSVIGKNCKIGEHVDISDCYIWDNVVVEDYCKLKQSIICNSSVLKSGTKVQPGCIISYNVILGPSCCVPQGTRITLKDSREFKASSGFDSDEDDAVIQETVETPSPFGAEGRGGKWELPSLVSADDSDIIMEKWCVEDSAASDSSFSEVSSHHSEPPEMESAAVEEAMFFYHEVLDSIRSGLVEKTSSENLILMINSSKHAYNIPIEDVPPTIIKAILEGPQTAELQTKELVEYVKKAVTLQKDMLSHYVKKRETQQTVLLAMGECALQKASLVIPVIPRLVLLLYDLDILEESEILRWTENLGTDPVYSLLATQMEPVVAWLQDAEEESGSDSS